MISDNIVNYTAHSLDDVIKIIKKFLPSEWVGGWIYRGQSNKEWKLLSKAGRMKFIGDYDLSRFFLWRRDAVAFKNNLPKNDWECLALAQHHGLATRLLDWTENPLVASFFACSELFNDDGIIFCYFPTHYVTEPESKEFKDYTNVVTFRSRAISPRILNQKALFTYHPKPQESVKEQMLPKEIDRGGQQLKKIIIPSKLKLNILAELNLYSINRSTLFPDLDGLSSHHNWMASSEI